MVQRTPGTAIANADSEYVSASDVQPSPGKVDGVGGPVVASAKKSSYLSDIATGGRVRAGAVAIESALGTRRSEFDPFPAVCAGRMKLKGRCHARRSSDHLPCTARRDRVEPLRSAYWPHRFASH